MTYSYVCSKCGHYFSLNLRIAEREKPLVEPCPHCDGQNTVEREFECPSIVSDFKDPVDRAGSGWKDVLKRVKKASGKENTINV